MTSVVPTIEYSSYGVLFVSVPSDLLPRPCGGTQDFRKGNFVQHWPRYIHIYMRARVLRMTYVMLNMLCRTCTHSPPHFESSALQLRNLRSSFDALIVFTTNIDSTEIDAIGREYQTFDIRYRNSIVAGIQYSL